MPKTREQLERDCNALIKYLLTELETLAGEDPIVASSPYTFEEHRRGVVRRVWTLFKEALAHEPGGGVQRS